MPALHVPHTKGPWAPPSFIPAEALRVSSYRELVRADSPVSYWRLGESEGTTAADSADSNPGTYTGGYTLAQTGALAGDANTAVALNGTTGYVTVAHNANLALTTDLTIEAWVNPTDFTVYNMIVTKDAGFTPAPYEFRLDQTTGLPLLLLDSSFTALQGTNAPTAGVWSHVVVTVSGTTWTHYLNGSPNGTGTFGGSRAADGGTALLIGGRADLNHFFKGGVDEVAVYPTALSAARVLAHYQAGVPPSAGPASFVLTASDSITFAESVTRVVSDARTVTDSITFAESVARTVANPRTISDSVTTSESLTRASQGLTRTSTDSVTFSESLARTRSSTRALSDSITFAESTLSSQGKTRTAADSITFAESLARAALGLTRSGTDTITFSESPSRTLSASRTSTDSVTFSESIVSGRSISRTGTDTLTFAESLTRTAGHPRTPVDSVTFSESAARTQSLTGRSATDGATFSESITSGRSISRTATDSAAFSESLVRSIGRTRSTSDSTTLTDSLTRGAQTFGRASTDSVTFAESVATGTHTATPATVLLVELSDRSRISLHIDTSARTAAMASDTLTPGTQVTDTPRVTVTVSTASRTSIEASDSPAQ